MRLKPLFGLILGLLLVQSSQAAIITLLPGQVHGNTTGTAANTAISSFTDGGITLSALPTQLINPTGANPTTFSGFNTRLGILNTGQATGGANNINAFNDLDTNPNNGNEELLGIQLSSTSGLTSISYDFSRADGTTANDGVIISGFISNPNVTFTLNNSALNGGASFGGSGVTQAEAFWDAGTGSVRLNIPGAQFNSTVRWINFDPVASLGQTLTVRTTDTDQAGSQLAVLSITYDNLVAVPEPSSFGLFSLSLLCVAYRRRTLK
jgi:hypothetical protein